MEFEDNGVLYQSVNTKYQSQGELTEDLLSVLDYRLYLHYKYHSWVGAENDMKNMLGLVVSREEFEYNLKKSVHKSIAAKATDEELLMLRDSERVVRDKIDLSDTSGFPLLELFERFGLDDFAANCVLLAYACAVDSKYEKLFAYLQDDISKTKPEIRLAISLFMPADGSVEKYTQLLSGTSGFLSLFEQEELGQGRLVLCPQVLGFIGGGRFAFPQGFTLFDPEYDSPENDIVIDMQTACSLDRFTELEGAGAALISGESGCGKSFQIRQLCARNSIRCVFADMRVISGAQAVEKAAMLAQLTDSQLCINHIDGFNELGEYRGVPAEVADAVEGLAPVEGKLFILSEKPVHLRLAIPALEIRIEPLQAADRLELFKSFLAGRQLGQDVSLEEIAYKFRFTPKQVRFACRQAIGAALLTGECIDNSLLHKSCYSQVVHKLDSLATRVKPNYVWDDVVLPDEQKRLMQHACAHIKYQHRVFDRWGFESKISYGRGLSVLFAGAPGTGKTMCAQVMAKQLNMEMYKINISQIVSKYIGETEKNLQAVFSEAKRSNCILFFDECDALFGKRSEVKDAHDRNANVEVAYLLQQIEEHDGVCILATNLVQNIDAAFMRRITYVVHFPFPDEKMREEIYRRTIPAQTPLADDIDWKFIAEKFNLSGGHIKNIVLSAAFMAAGQNSAIGMRQLLNAAVNELKKNEIVVVREDLREYADLIDN